MGCYLALLHSSCIYAIMTFRAALVASLVSMYYTGAGECILLLVLADGLMCPCVCVQGEFLHNMLQSQKSIVYTMAVNEDGVMASGADNGSLW